MGRFLTRDVWGGDYNSPLSLNRWAYTEGNPVNFTDPSGYIKQGSEEKSADSIRMRLAMYGVMIVKDWGYQSMQLPTTSFNIDILGNTFNSPCQWYGGAWELKDLLLIESATDKLKRVLGGPNKIKAAVGQFSVEKLRISGQSGMMTYSGFMKHWFGADVVIYSESDNEAWYKYAFVHEFAHVWDNRNGNRLSLGLIKTLGTWVCSDEDHQALNPVKKPLCWFPLLMRTDPVSGKIYSQETPPDTLKYCITNPADQSCDKLPYSQTYGGNDSVPWKGGPAGAEDWAVSFGYFVYPEYRGSVDVGLGHIRRQYVKKQIANLP